MATTATDLYSRFGATPGSESNDELNTEDDIYSKFGATPGQDAEEDL